MSLGAVCIAPFRAPQNFFVLDDQTKKPSGRARGASSVACGHAFLPAAMDLNSLFRRAGEGEDRVSYRIFDDSIPAGGAESDKDEQAHRAALKRALDGVRDYVARLTRGYLWHREGFGLQVVPGRRGGDSGARSASTSSMSEPPPCAHLAGSTRFGDCVEDEWYVVWILLQLTRRFRGLTAQVEDGDGQFLLIEAAECLPDWLGPETAANRAWLRGGELVIIPRPSNPTQLVDIPAHLDAQSGLGLARQGKHRLSLESAQSVVAARVRATVSAVAQNNRHHARILLPLAAARALRQDPALIAPACSAFCSRDPIDMRASRKLATLGAKGPTVAIRARFTRLLYAQTTREKLRVPAALAAPARALAALKLTHPKRRAFELGCKVALGLEIMCQRAMKAGARAPPQDIKRPEPASDVSSQTRDAAATAEASGLAWESYRSALEKRGWFKGFLEHSAPWKERLGLAREEFLASRDKTRTKRRSGARKGGDSTSQNPRFSQYYALHAALASTRSLTASDFTSFESLQQDDDEKWLHLTPESLEEALRGRRPGGGGAAAEDAAVLADMARRMGAFVKAESSHEGVEMRDTDETSRNGRSGPFSPVSFDFNAMMSALSGAAAAPTTPDSDDVDSDDDTATPVGPARGKSNVKKMPAYMRQMDAELAGAGLSSGFARETRPAERERKRADAAPSPAREDLPPVDVDLNLVKNLLESYSAQAGMPGPASSLLGSLGIALPDDADRTAGPRDDAKGMVDR